MRSRWRDLRALLALGAWLARRRTAVTLSLVFAAVTTVALAAVAATMASRGRFAAASLAGVSSEILAWGPGMLLVFGAGLHALRNDADEGALSLAFARGVSLRDFVLARAVSFARLLASVVGLGTLLVTVAAAVAARSSPLALTVLHAGFAGALHALAFATVMAPVALATIGSRSRTGGYVALLIVLVVPELARIFVRDLPREWTELLSVPSALATLRTALSPGRVDVMRALGASLVIVLVSLSAFAASLHQAASLVRQPGRARPSPSREARR